MQSSKYLTQKCWHLEANNHKHCNTARVRGGNQGSAHKTQPWLSHKPYGRDSKISTQEASSKFSALFWVLWDSCRKWKPCSRDQGHQQWTLHLQSVIKMWVFCRNGEKTNSILSCFIFVDNWDNTKSCCKSGVKLAVVKEYMKFYPLGIDIWHFYWNKPWHLQIETTYTSGKMMPLIFGIILVLFSWLTSLTHRWTDRFWHFIWECICSVSQS